MRFICVVLCLLTTLPAVAAASSRVAIPPGTQVSVHIIEPLDSGTANVGDPFTFKTIDDVVAGGYVVIRGGSLGHGTVAKVDRAGRNGHSGSLGLQFNDVTGVDGKLVKLTNDKSGAAASDDKGKTSTASMVGMLVFGYAGLLAHNFVRGHNVTVSSTQTFVAYVSESQHVLASQHQADINNPFGPSAAATPRP